MCELPVDYVSALAAQRARQVAVSGQLGPFRGVRLSEKREKRESSREREIILHRKTRLAAAHLPHFSPSFFDFPFDSRPAIIIKQPKFKLIQAAREMNNPGTSRERNI